MAKLPSNKKTDSAADAKIKAEKKAARLQKIKDRPAGQRPNSKQVDVIDLGNGNKVVSYGYPIRNIGTYLTTVLLDKIGNPISMTNTVLAGTRIKVKKEHGTIVPGLLGVKKSKKSKEEESEDDD